VTKTLKSTPKLSRVKTTKAMSEWVCNVYNTSRSTHYRSFRRRSSRQSLALVWTTKINSKINQTNTKKQNTIIYYLHTFTQT